MKLELPLKIKSLKIHAVIDVPGKEDTEFDLTVNDIDGDGDPNFKVLWDLPGQLLDSGSKGLTGEIPIGSVLSPVVEMVVGLAASVAPDWARPFLAGLGVSFDD